MDNSFLNQFKEPYSHKCIDLFNLNSVDVKYIYEFMPDDNIKIENGGLLVKFDNDNQILLIIHNENILIQLQYRNIISTRYYYHDNNINVKKIIFKVR